MSLTTVAILGYVVTYAVAIVMTLREQRQTGGRPAALMAAGCMACLVWPLTVVVMLVTIRQRAV